MESQEALARFREADHLFGVQCYPQALAILDELDRVYPQTKNVMYPRACCLYKLGRLSEAEALCDTLIERFSHTRAAELKQSMAASMPPALNYLSNLDILDYKPPSSPRTKPLKPSTDWAAVLKIGSIVAAVILVVGLAAWALIHAQANRQTSSAPSRVERITEQSHRNAPMLRISKDRRFVVYGNRLTWWGNALVNYVLHFVMFTLNLFLTLLAINKLPHDTWTSNVLHCMAMSALCSAISLIPLIGFIFNLLILRQNYEFRFVDFLTLMGISLVTGIFLVAIPLGVIITYG